MATSVMASSGGGQLIIFGPYFNASSILYPSPKIYHYASGTTTLKNCWSDEGKVTAVAQPFVGDAYGVATMYCDGDYKFVIKDASGNTLYTWDNYKVTSDTATMWEGNFGTSYPTAATTNRWHLFAKVSATNAFTELGICDGTKFVPISANFIDVRNYGVKGDDSTNDATALNTMIDTVDAGSVIYMPPLTYKITSAWNIDKKVKIIAFGATLKSYGDIEAIVMGGTAADAMASYIQIEGLNVTNNLTDYRDSTKAGIHMKYGAYWVLRDVKSNGFNEGIHFDAKTFSGDVFGGKFSANLYGVYFEDESAGNDGGINDIAFYGTTFSGNGTFAGGDNVRIIDGDNIKFYGGSNESAGTQGISTISGGNQGSYDIVVDGVWFESNNDYDMKFNTLNRIFIKNTRHENWSANHSPYAIYVAKDDGGLSVDGMSVRNTSTGVYTAVFMQDAGSAKIDVSNLLKDDAIKLYETTGTKRPIASDSSNGMRRQIGIVEVVKEDFIDDAAAWASTFRVKDFWTAGGTNGTVAIESRTNGIALLTTAAVDNDSANIIFIPDILDTDDDPVVEIRAKLNPITTAYLFIGLCQAAFNNKDTQPNNYAGFEFDTDVHATNIYAVTRDNATAEVSTDTTIDLSAATEVVFKIDLTVLADPKFFISDAEVASAHAGTVKSDIIMYPCVHVQSLAASAATSARVDYINAWQKRI